MVNRGEVYLVNLDPTVGSKVQKRCTHSGIIDSAALKDTASHNVSSAKQRACPHVRAPKKTRPCVIVSPDEMNQYIRTIVIAPMSTTQKNYKSRVAINFDDKKGQVMLDQIRTIDKKRLITKLGILSAKELKAVLSVLQEMFAY